MAATLVTGQAIAQPFLSWWQMTSEKAAEEAEARRIVLEVIIAVATTRLVADLTQGIMEHNGRHEMGKTVGIMAHVACGLVTGLYVDSIQPSPLRVVLGISGVLVWGLSEWLGHIWKYLIARFWNYLNNRH